MVAAPWPTVPPVSVGYQLAEESRVQAAFRLAKRRLGASPGSLDPSGKQTVDLNSSTKALVASSLLSYQTSTRSWTR